MDVFNPSPTGNAVYNMAPDAIERIRSANTGIYVQDQIDIGNLSVMVGLRHDKLKETYREDVLAFTSHHNGTQVRQYSKRGRCRSRTRQV